MSACLPQGDLGFFKLQRGVNALHIEAGDCWCVPPPPLLGLSNRRGEQVASMQCDNSC